MRYKLWLFLVPILFFASCSEYQKVMKGTDFEKKFALAKKYYQEENYNRTIDLIEPTLSFSTGTEKGEEILFIYSYSLFRQHDYVMAGYYFKKYTNTYPTTPRTEEALYMSAFCSYKDSPKPHLDQGNTLRAIKEFELFISRYPESDRLADCNKYIDKLREKMEEKSFINAKLYFDMEVYNGADIALKNSLKEFPDSKYREEIMYLIVKTNFEYAENSIPSKQEERYKKTLKEAAKFRSAFQKSEFEKDIARMEKKANNFLAEINHDNA